MYLLEISFFSNWAPYRNYYSHFLFSSSLCFCSSFCCYKYSFLSALAIIVFIAYYSLDIYVFDLNWMSTAWDADRFAILSYEFFIVVEVFDICFPCLLLFRFAKVFLIKYLSLGIIYYSETDTSFI